MYSPRICVDGRFALTASVAKRHRVTRAQRIVLMFAISWSCVSSYTIALLSGEELNLASNCANLSVDGYQTCDSTAGAGRRNSCMRPADVFLRTLDHIAAR